jgi:hypothetical protein
LSCGIAPIDANWKMRLPRPMVVWPSTTVCAPMLVPSPMRTCAPIVA